MNCMIGCKDSKGGKPAYEFTWECTGAHVAFIVAIAVCGKSFANRRSSHTSSCDKVWPWPPMTSGVDNLFIVFIMK